MEMIRSSNIQLVFGEMSLCVKKCGIQISTKWLLAINYNGKGKAIVFSTRNETSLDLFMKKICKCMKRYYSSFIVSNGNSCALSLSLIILEDFSTPEQIVSWEYKAIWCQLIEQKPIHAS